MSDQLDRAISAANGEKLAPDQMVQFTVQLATKRNVVIALPLNTSAIEVVEFISILTTKLGAKMAEMQGAPKSSLPLSRQLAIPQLDLRKLRRQ